MAREHFSNLKFTVFIDIFLISILYPDEKEKKKKLRQDSFGYKSQGGNIPTEIKIPNFATGKDLHLSEGLPLLLLKLQVWLLAPGIHLGREAKQTLSSPGFSYRKSKCGWYRGAVPLGPWEVGAGERVRVSGGAGSGVRELAVRTAGPGRRWFGAVGSRCTAASSPPVQREGQETVKAELRCAFPDRLCLILPPAPQTLTPPSSAFSRPPYP